MSFLWPQMLWMLPVLPGCVLGYLWLMRRRKVAMVYPSLAPIREAIGPRQGWRRFVPPALMLLALSLLVMGCACVQPPPPQPPVVVPPPEVPPLPQSARQPAAPPLCSPTCSDGLKRLLDSLLR